MSIPIVARSLDLAPQKSWRQWVPAWIRGLIWVDSASHYDAFLSYSWKSDSKIAPTIQSVLQQFLCPWYRMRAKTVFRDLSSLPAGSSLEGELFDRLDRSTHLIVLASSQSAQSAGMEMEGQHWYSKPREGDVLLIVTEGEYMTWPEIREHLLPPSLRAKLITEPLFVPLQHLRGKILDGPDDVELNEKLIDGLKQIILRLYVGDTWEQLRGEERAHRRRALRLVLSVSAVLLFLAIAALAASFSFLKERDLAIGRQLAAEASELRVRQSNLVNESTALAIEAARRLSPIEADMALRPSLALLPRPRLTLVQSNIGSNIRSSRDERYLVTYGTGNSAYIWRAEDGSRVGSFVHGNRITSASFNPEGDLIATADLDGSLWLHRLPGLEPVQRLSSRQGIDVVWFAPGGTLLTIERGPYMGGSVYTGILRRWQRTGANDQEWKSIVVRSDLDSMVGANSKDGRYFAASSKSDGVILYDAVLDKILFKTGSELVTKSVLTALAMTADAKHLAIGDFSGMIRRCDVEEGVCKDLGPLGGTVFSLAFNDSGSRIAAGQGSSIAMSSVISAGWSMLPSDSIVNYVTFVVTKGSEGIIAASQDGLIRVWNGKEVARIQKLAQVQGFVINQAKTEITAITSSDTARVFQLSSGDEVWQIPTYGGFPVGVASSSISPDGQRICVGLGAAGNAHLLQRDNLQIKEIAEFQGGQKVLFSPSGDFVVGIDNGSSTHGNVEEAFFTIADGTSGKTLNRLFHQHPFENPPPGKPPDLRLEITAAAFNLDGKRLVTGDSVGGVSVWDPVSGSSVGNFSLGGKVLAVAVDPRNRVIAIGENGRTLRWTMDGKTTEEHDFDGGIKAAALSRDGRRLAFTYQRQLRIVETNGWSTISSFEANPAAVSFNAGAEFVATISYEPSLGRVYRVKTGEEIAQKSNVQGLDISFSLDDRMVITGGSAWLWKSEDIRDESCRRLPRNLTPAEWNRYAGANVPFRCVCSDLPCPKTSDLEASQNTSTTKLPERSQRASAN